MESEDTKTHVLQESSCKQEGLQENVKYVSVPLTPRGTAVTLNMGTGIMILTDIIRYFTFLRMVELTTFNKNR